ncbi:MAG: hypothetical protein ABSE49_16760 [Polyangiaceae bacterium]|jgi:hypothetical protein
MTNDRRDKLEAIRREQETQEDQLRRLYAMAAKLGDVEIAVPRDLLDQVIGTNPERATPVMGVRA